MHMATEPSDHARMFQEQVHDLGRQVPRFIMRVRIGQAPRRVVRQHDDVSALGLTQDLAQPLELRGAKRPLPAPRVIHGVHRDEADLADIVDPWPAQLLVGKQAPTRIGNRGNPGGRAFVHVACGADRSNALERQQRAASRRQADDAPVAHGQGAQIRIGNHGSLKQRIVIARYAEPGHIESR